jgi:hypothetical protein
MSITPSAIKKYFLILASATIFAVGLLYGVSPYWFASQFLGVSGLDTNLAHILRAFMCLYISFGFFWLFAAFSKKYRNAAVLTTVLFPAGLVIGRVISFHADGRPAPLLLFYMAAEFIQAPIALWVFRLPE